jgi:hypothetical protein
MISLNLSAQPKVMPTTREMNLLTWTKFKEFVPHTIETVDNFRLTGSIKEPQMWRKTGRDQNNRQEKKLERNTHKKINRGRL